MSVIALLYLFITWGVTAVIVAAIVLIVLRALFNYMDVNPFSWSARTVGRVTDPVVMPVRRVLVAFRIDPRVAPFIAVILIIVAGYLTVQVAGTILNTMQGIVSAITSGRAGAPVAIIGYVIYGFLGLYTLAIFIRIIFSWLSMSYANPLMRLLFRATEPLLGSVRRFVRPVGMFDISPIIAFLIVWICQAAVAATLLAGWPTRFF
ncbi:MAG TPA: YggT family protein [Pyrinomonadaceae bacterium]|nr:YggT family protein [Pyrinomonadaceae bacterium]